MVYPVKLAPLKRAWLCPLCTLLPGMRDGPWAISSSCYSSGFPPRRRAAVPKVCLWPCVRLCAVLYISLVLGRPEQDTALQAWPHQCRVEEWDHLPQPAGSPLSNARWDTISLLCCKDTLLPGTHLGAHQDSQGLFGQAAFQQSIHSSRVYSPIYTGAWGWSSPGAGLCTLLFEFHEVPL